MGRVIKNDPIISQWLSKYGFHYDSNCHIVECSGFERYYYSADRQIKDWVTICPSKACVYLSKERLDGTVAARSKISVPNSIDMNNEDIFISWLDEVVG